jgi:hypothetical protein
MLQDKAIVSHSVSQLVKIIAAILADQFSTSCVVVVKNQSPAFSLSALATMP